MKARIPLFWASVILLALILLGGCAPQKAQSFSELVKNGTPQAVKAAIEKGAYVNASDWQDTTVLMFAAGNNPNPEVITTLLKAGADIEARSGSNQPWTALMWAAQSTTNPDVITTLLKAGADIKEPDKDGLTPLMIAAENNDNPKVITTLVSAGADLDAKDNNGFTALMQAASKSHNPDVVIALIKAGANVKAKNKAGYAAIDYAKANQYLKDTEAIKQL